MPDKDTTEMEKELLQIKTEDELKTFFEENEENLPELTLAEYLKFLPVEKNLSKVDVIKNSCIGNYAYKIFSGERKNNSRTKILSLAVAMKLYSKNIWGDMIIFSLNKGYDIHTINKLLTDSLKPLLGDVD